MRYDELLGKAIMTRSNCNRDQLQLTGRGISAARVQLFQDMIDLFLNMPTDIELLGLIQEKVEQKKAAREALITSMQSIMGRVIQKDGFYSPDYRRFGTGKITKWKENDLPEVAARVVRIGIANLADYASEGLTAAMLSDLNDLLLAFNTAIENLQDAYAGREMATEDRLRKANTLYKEMMYLANVGKNIWQGTDEAKYNDYVIFKTPLRKKAVEENGVKGDLKEE